VTITYTSLKQVLETNEGAIGVNYIWNTSQHTCVCKVKKLLV